MADEGQDQNRSEEATPYKLRKARERGSVARGTDLSFFSGLAALACFLTASGAVMVERLATMMRRVFVTGLQASSDPAAVLDVARQSYWPVLSGVMLFAGTVLALVALIELLQLRGIVFSATPLKPDFSRINPAKGLKRLFSLRMLKETAKSIVKLAAYVTVAILVIRAAAARGGLVIVDAPSLVTVLHAAGMRLLWCIAATAIVIAALDQFITRREFAKQMRMSRRDVTREHREREGEPRLKSKRKQIHAELIKQGKGAAAIPGSDVLIVNPEHYAVALGYDRQTQAAPLVRARARNLQALVLKRLAQHHGVPIIANAPLARALFRDARQGDEIGEAHYREVAELYFRLGLNRGQAPAGISA